MTAPRVRLVRAEVRLELVVDDGENLTPIGVDPLIVTAKDWPAFAVAGMESALAELQARVAAQHQDETPGTADS